MKDSSSSLRTMGTPAGFEPGAALPKVFDTASVCFVWRDDKILASEGEPPTLPTFADITRLGVDGARHYLGRYQGVDCIALRVGNDVPELGGWQWRGVPPRFPHIPPPHLPPGRAPCPPLSRERARRSSGPSWQP